MIYYKSDSNLILFNTNTKKYFITNKEKKTILTKEEFDSLNTEKIKKQKYCELMNNYFKSNKHKWEFNGQKFKKLDNFEINTFNFIYSKIPKHNNILRNYNLILVYHWGKIYYMLVSQYLPKAQLIDCNTLKIVRWVDIKNVSPIFNINTKYLCGYF